MSSGSWENNDGLFLQYGTAKATPELGGDYMSFGSNRVAEVLIPLSTITSLTTPTIVSNTLFFPEGQGIIVEKVEAFAEQAMSLTTVVLSVGVIQNDRTTAATTGGATAFIASVSGPAFTTAGALVTYTAGTAGAGGLIGLYNTQWNTNTTNGLNSCGGYITAQVSGATTATGSIRVRIYYHGVGTIQY